MPNKNIIIEKVENTEEMPVVYNKTKYKIALLFTAVMLVILLSVGIPLIVYHMKKQKIEKDTLVDTVKTHEKSTDLQSENISSEIKPTIKHSCAELDAKTFEKILISCTEFLDFDVKQFVEKLKTHLIEIQNKKYIADNPQINIKELKNEKLDEFLNVFGIPSKAWKRMYISAIKKYLSLTRTPPQKIFSRKDIKPSIGVIRRLNFDDEE